MTDLYIGDPLGQDPVGQTFPGMDFEQAPDTEAPWGINERTGKPYTKSPEERAEIGARLAEGRRNAAATGGGRRKAVKAPRRRSAGPSTATASSAASGPSHHDTLTGVLVQLPSFVCELLGRFNHAFSLDSAAFVLHGPPLVDAAVLTAQSDQRVAAWIDRLGEVTPWTMLLAAGLPLGLQIAANHKAIPPNPDLGILTEEQLYAELARRHGQAA